MLQCTGTLKTYAESKKPVTKENIAYDSIYMKSPEQENLERSKLEQGLPKVEVGGK